MNLGQRFPERQVGSNSEPLSIQLVRYGAPLDLTDATVRFRMVDAISGVVKVASGAGAGSSNGVASYTPALADLDTPGEYTCQFICTMADSTVHRSEVVYLRVLGNP